MRKIIFLMHVSLDGYVAGPNGEMDWIVYNAEVEKYSHDLHASTDAAMYGRNTYEMMAAYWPTVLSNPESTEADRNHARWADAATKYVVSTTLKSADWANTVIISDNVKDEVTKIRQQAGKDIWLLGSATLAQSLMQLGLIDEYRLNVNPVILGGGQRLFSQEHPPVNLRLLEAKTFSGGVVALRYAPAEA